MADNKPRKQAHCKGCGAPIQWARNENGKGIPLDIEPVEDGNVALVELIPGGEWNVRHVHREETTDAPRYNAHFRTCPNASEFRKDKR